MADVGDTVLLVLVEILEETTCTSKQGILDRVFSGIRQRFSNVCLELNFLVCKSKDAAYYDLYLQTGSDTPSGRTCSNYQTIHLPCLC
jgi:hypothetical protein